MRARVILTDMTVGLTQEIQAALEVAADFSGLRPAQFARQAVIEKLVREGYLRHPGVARFENAVPKQAAE
jgi:hypothetical protein